jgi:2'-5' RNA ligase
MDNFFAGLAGRWPPGREDYCWHVLPGFDGLGDRLAGQYRELLDWPGLARVSAEWMHVTLQHLAPASEVSGAQLSRMIRMVQGRCRGITPFTVTIGRAEAWETSVACPVRPADMLRHLRQVIVDASGEVAVGRFAAGESPFLPHLTLAYAVVDVGSEPVRAWIADCEAAELRLPVTKLALVAQRHDRHQITWRVIDEVVLAGAT